MQMQPLGKSGVEPSQSYAGMSAARRVSSGNGPLSYSYPSPQKLVLPVLE